MLLRLQPNSKRIRELASSVSCHSVNERERREKDNHGWQLKVANPIRQTRNLQDAIPSNAFRIRTQIERTVFGIPHQQVTFVVCVVIKVNLISLNVQIPSYGNLTTSYHCDMNATLCQDGLALWNDQDSNVIIHTTTTPDSVESDYECHSQNPRCSHEMYALNLERTHPFENQCRFPIITANEPDLAHHIRHYSGVNCGHKPNSLLVRQFDDGQVMFGQTFPRPVDGHVQCVAMEISGAMTPKINKFRYTNRTFPLKRYQRMSVGFDNFVVKCTNQLNKTVFESAFADFSSHRVQKLISESKISQKVEAEPKFSISILVLDSVSRNQFFRHMPKTLELMHETGFLTLWGYNKVADNSAVNLMPILAGRTFNTDLQGIRSLIPPDFVNDHTMLRGEWHEQLLTKRVKQEGYVTMWNDDIMVPKLGLFSYDYFHGFSRPPADFYYRPYYTFLYSKKRARSHCVNGRLVSRDFLRLWRRFCAVFRSRPHFSFNFLTALTHDDPAALGLLDEDLAKSLREMTAGQVEDNTVIVLMGDHGHRTTSIQKTYTGRVEERMPLFSIRLPSRFHQMYPDKVENLKNNLVSPVCKFQTLRFWNKFVANYDIHETLKDVLGLNESGLGISLFKPIPLNRTCADLKVPEHHCTCMEKLNGAADLGVENEINARLLPFVHRQLGQLPCITHFNLTNQTFQHFSLNPMARFGMRDLRMRKAFLKQKRHRAPADNEVVVVETAVRMEVLVWSRAVRLELVARANYNKVSGHLRFVAEPWAKLSECRMLLLRRICECFKE